MRLDRRRRLGEARVGVVADRFGHGGELGRRLYPSHGAGERNRNKLAFIFISRKDDSKSEAVSCSKEQAVEAIFEVMFGKARRTEPRVRMSEGSEDA